MRNGEKVSILIVDDNPTNLHTLFSYLEEWDFETLVATSGEQAIQQLQLFQPDLILLDVLMPGIDGFETCRRLKENETTKDIPIIFMTALSDTADKIKGFDIGGVDYITKPFQPEEVLARINVHLTIRNLQAKLREHVQLLKSELKRRRRAEGELKKIMKQIEQAKKEWESAADSLSYIVCLLDNQWHIIRANRTIEHWNLGQVIDVKGREMHEFFHPNCTDPACYLKKFLSQAREEVAHGRPVECEAEDKTLQRSLSLQVRPILAQMDGEWKALASFAVGSVNDITKHKQVEDSLRQHNYELAVLNRMNNSFQACHTEEEMYNVVVSVCEELFPLGSGGLYMMDVSQPILNLVASWGNLPPDIQTFGLDECWSFLHGKVYAVEDLNTEPLCVHLHSFLENGYLCVPIRTSDQILGILHVCFDQNESDYSNEEYKHKIESKQMVITRVMENYAISLVNLRLREALRMEAIRDPLTDLYNRRYMEESLKREALRAKRHGTSVGIIMLDIDHFKHLNDTYGHEAGDIVLQELGALLRRHIRYEDIACRYGGEEFLLIMPKAPLKIVKQRAEELRILVKDLLRIRWQAKILAITISIGVAAFPNHGYNVKDVVNAVDTALYQAKARGRDQVVVAPL